MAVFIRHTQKGQAKKIYDDFIIQNGEQPIVIDKEYTFLFPNGAKVIFVYNRKGYIHLYIPVAVFLSNKLVGYRFDHLAENGITGKMEQKGSGCLYYDLDQAPSMLRDLYLHNKNKGINWKVNY